MVEALQLRASGISRLADAFRNTAKSKNASDAGQLLSKQAQLLVASDVNWDFYFRKPSLSELKRQNITGVPVPDSNVLVNTDLASTSSMIPVWQRVHGATSPQTTPTGVHGVGLVATRVLPGGEQLSPSREAQEVKVPVVLTIQKTPSPIVKRGTISLIDVGATQTITFHITEQPPFSTPTRIKVMVGPVPAEKTLTNNSATYPVIFSFGA